MSCDTARSGLLKIRILVVAGKKLNTGRIPGMTRQVIFTPEAEDDIIVSYRWYETQELGLGEEFLRCIEASIERIQRQPFLYQVVVDGFRCALVRRFPYEIFYEPTDENIIIHSVFHCSQNPEKWQKILRRTN